MLHTGIRSRFGVFIAAIVLAGCGESGKDSGKGSIPAPAEKGGDKPAVSAETDFSWDTLVARLLAFLEQRLQISL